MLRQIRELPPENPRDDIAHPVVVAQLFMLIPRGRLATLRRPFSDPVRVVVAVRQQEPAARACDDLVPVPRKNPDVAEAARLDPLEGRAKGFRGVFHDQRAMLRRDRLDFVDLARRPVEVRDDDQPNVGVQFKRLLQRDGIHVPRFAFRIDEDGRSPFVADRVDRRVERHVGSEDPAPRQRPAPDRRLPVQLLRAEPDRQMQRRRPARQPDRMPDPDKRRRLPFDRVDVRPDRADPVRLNRLVDPTLLVPVHRRTAQPHLAFERRYA